MPNPVARAMAMDTSSLRKMSTRVAGVVLSLEITLRPGFVRYRRLCAVPTRAWPG